MRGCELVHAPLKLGDLPFVHRQQLSPILQLARRGLLGALYLERLG